MSVYRLGYAGEPRPGTFAGDPRPLYGKWPSHGYPVNELGMGDVIAGSERVHWTPIISRNWLRWPRPEISRLVEPRPANPSPATFLRLPDRPEIDGNLNEQLIVEYYSR